MARGCMAQISYKSPSTSGRKRLRPEVEGCRDKLVLTRLRTLLPDKSRDLSGKSIFDTDAMMLHQVKRGNLRLCEVAKLSGFVA